MGKILNPAIAETLEPIEYGVQYNQTHNVVGADGKVTIKYKHVAFYVYNILDPQGTFLETSQPFTHETPLMDDKQDFLTADAAIDLLKKQWYKDDVLQKTDNVI